LSREFDVVLIDSPPVLGLADAPMMAAIVDGVLFVVEADRSRHGSLKAALRRLRSVSPNLLGGVLTSSIRCVPATAIRATTATNIISTNIPTRKTKTDPGMR
jgi:Mrp family chromosome partitioning ATPase